MCWQALGKMDEAESEFVAVRKLGKK